MSRPRTIPVGERFGRLVVAEERTVGQLRVKCRCDCGKDHTVVMQEWGRTQSCGCLRDEVTTQRSYRHGHSGTSIYWTWADMVGRCTNRNHKRWADYGGRGITVCERWLTFANFLADMGERPPGLELDRIDNDRGYEPSNCRWTIRSINAENRRHPEHPRDSLTGRYISEAAG